MRIFEAIVEKVSEFVIQNTTDNPFSNGHRLYLERLKGIAALMSKKPLDVIYDASSIGYSSSTHIILPCFAPERFPSRSAHFDFLLWRTVFGSYLQMDREKMSAAAVEYPNLDKLQESARSGIKVFMESLTRRHLKSLDPSLRLHELSPPDLLHLLLLGRVETTFRPKTQSKHSDEIPSGQRIAQENTLAVQSATKMEYIELDESADNPLMHVFEKTLTLEEYQGGKRPIDDTENLTSYKKALEQVRMRKVVRTGTPSASEYRTESTGYFDSQESTATKTPARFQYSEWSEDKQQYLAEWCTIVESQPPTSGLKMTLSPANQKMGQSIRELIRSRSNMYRWCRRQEDGVDIDLEATVDFLVNQKTRKNSDSRIWLARRKREQEVLVHILLDCSLSADSWVNNARVFDYTDAFVGTAALAFADISRSISMAGFASHTRHDCRYYLFKELADSWKVGLERFKSVQPHGYTRLGPALRHSVQLMHGRKEQRKHLLILTDARPTDQDYYEGAHGLGDVRKAVLECESSEIQVHTLIVNESLLKNHSSMFPQQNIQLAQAPNKMGVYLAEFAQKILS